MTLNNSFPGSVMIPPPELVHPAEPFSVMLGKKAERAACVL